MRRPLLAAVPAVLALAVGCGGSSSNDDPPAASENGGVAAGDVLVKDERNDAVGRRRKDDVDLRSVTVLRKQDLVQVRMRHWQEPETEVVYRVQFAVGDREEEIRVVRPVKGDPGLKTEDGGEVEGGKAVVGDGGTLLVQLPQDALTRQEEFGFRTYAKSADGAATDRAPEAFFGFPSGKKIRP